MLPEGVFGVGRVVAHVTREMSQLVSCVVHFGGFYVDSWLRSIWVAKVLGLLSCGCMNPLRRCAPRLPFAPQKGEDSPPPRRRPGHTPVDGVACAISRPCRRSLGLCERGGRRQGSPLRCGQVRVGFCFVWLDLVHEQIEFVAFRGVSGRVEDVINAVYCRLIGFVCSNQRREHGRSKAKEGGRWSGGRRVMPRAYYARAAGVGLLGWSKGSGECAGMTGCSPSP